MNLKKKKKNSPPIPHLLHAQQALALLYAKAVGCPSTGSYPTPSPDPTLSCKLQSTYIWSGVYHHFFQPQIETFYRSEECITVIFMKLNLQARLSISELFPGHTSYFYSSLFIALLVFWLGMTGLITVMILSFWTDMPEQTVQTQIKLRLEEQSDQGLHCLPFRLHCLDSLLCGRTT